MDIISCIHSDLFVYLPVHNPCRIRSEVVTIKDGIPWPGSEKKDQFLQIPTPIGCVPASAQYLLRRERIPSSRSWPIRPSLLERRKFRGLEAKIPVRRPYEAGKWGRPYHKRENYFTWKRKKRIILTVLASTQCGASEVQYRHHEADQRGSLYLKRKWLKFLDKYNKIWPTLFL